MANKGEHGSAMIKKILLISVPLLILIGLGIWFRPQDEKPPALPEPTKVESLPREVLLYFADPAGSYLVSETQQIDGCDEDRECLRNLFMALVQGPQGELLPILPEQTRIRNIELRDDVVVVDFNDAFVHGHPGGSLSELLTVYGLANSMAVNFPYLKRVQILVEGEPVETLKGHVSLVRPVPADFSFSRPPQVETHGPADE